MAVLVPGRGTGGEPSARRDPGVPVGGHVRSLRLRHRVPRPHGVLPARGPLRCPRIPRSAGARPRRPRTARDRSSRSSAGGSESGCVPDSPRHPGRQGTRLLRSPGHHRRPGSPYREAPPKPTRKPVPGTLCQPGLKASGPITRTSPERSPASVPTLRHRPPYGSATSAPRTSTTCS